MPLPRILIMGIAGADRDRAGVDVAVVDVPAFLAGISRSAAGEFGQCAIEARSDPLGKSSYKLGWKQIGRTANCACCSAGNRAPQPFIKFGNR
jgi:hypothetical protein